jgi:DNA-binding IclR family transcriptional regulator
MGFWRKKEADFDEMYTIVEEEAGMSARELAKRIEVSPSTVTRLLPSMEEAGYLLSEDDDGRLWPFKRRK